MPRPTTWRIRPQWGLINSMGADHGAYNTGRERIAVHEEQSKISAASILGVFLWVVAFSISSGVSAVRAEDQVRVKYSRSELEAQWQARLSFFLAKGVIPLIDLESTISRKQAEEDLLTSKTLAKMDDLGIALIAFDANQAPPGRGEPQGGYRWGYHMHQAVNAYPDRFILTTNAGNSEMAQATVRYDRANRDAGPVWRLCDHGRV